MTPWLVGAGSVAGLVCLWGFLARCNWLTALETLESAVRTTPRRCQTRGDLPPEVLALALRMGAKSESSANYVSFKQAGEMWRAPGRKPMTFKARQTNSLTALDYIWQARFAPFSALIAVDYNVFDHAGLEVYLAGIFPVVKKVGNPEIQRGEMMRYLAELALMPDAILRNWEIDWKVLDATTFLVGRGFGVERIEVTLHLGANGLVERIEAASRPALEGKAIVNRPWGGRFWDYQQREGRAIPMQAEVYWVIDAKPFVYWRGRLTQWAMESPKRSAGTAPKASRLFAPPKPAIND